ncbi:MAG: DUF3352 domain-containing protein [Actinomycetota bacterium]|nr:DUF3352 domain-containing protein [Actinomycetota bacterium]
MTQSPPRTGEAQPARAGAVQRRRALVAVGLAVAAVIALLVLALGSGGGQRQPATGAARLVPTDALLYLHVSTDGERDAVQRTFDLARRFPRFSRLAGALSARLPTGGQPLSSLNGIASWIGPELGLAVLDAGGKPAGSVVIVAVSDRRRAESFLRRGGARMLTSYQGTVINRYGSGASAFVGRYLVLGQQPGIRAAIDRYAGRAPALNANPTFRRAMRGMPAGRVADAYASPAGVRRALRSRGGPLGIASVLLDQPGLAGVGMAVTPADGGARIRLHSIGSGAAPGGNRAVFAPFHPGLAGAVPKTAMAYLGLTGLDRAAGRLLGLAAASGPTGARLQSLLQTRGRDIARRAGVNVARDVLPLFHDEVALWIAPSLPVPYVTVIAHTDREADTRVALARLQAPLTQLFTAPETGSGAAPTFAERNVSGTKTFSLALSPGVEINYAVFDGKLVISTSLEGIRQVKRASGPLTDTDAYQATLGDHPRQVTSLVFLDFSQLLGLGERTGLNASRGYLAVRDDLKRVRALGASTSGGGTESTTELFLSIK